MDELTQHMASQKTVTQHEMRMHLAETADMIYRYVCGLRKNEIMDFADQEIGKFIDNVYNACYRAGNRSR